MNAMTPKEIETLMLKMDGTIKNEQEVSTGLRVALNAAQDMILKKEADLSNAMEMLQARDKEVRDLTIDFKATKETCAALKIGVDEMRKDNDRLKVRLFDYMERDED